MSAFRHSRFTNDDDDRDDERPTTSSPATLPGSDPLTCTGGVSDPLDVQVESAGGEGAFQTVNLSGSVTEGREETEMGAEAQEESQQEGEVAGEGEREEHDDLQIYTTSDRWSCRDCYRWVMSNAVMLYISQTLSAWGDRMWSFAVSIYLVEIEEQSMRLTAVYGLCVSGSALLFGAAIGKWVDKTPRLRAVRTSLVIQNTTVIVNACLLCIILVYKDDILPIWNGALYIICQLIVILLGTIASLTSLAEKICIQKDWVVVIADGDAEVLAGLNANMRRIDLLVNILAPIAVGAIMSASMLVGGIFIAAWNAGSLFMEYWNIHRVYNNVPRLAIKGGQQGIDASAYEVSETDREEGEKNGNNVSKEGAQDDGDEEFTKIAATPVPAPSPAAPASSSTQKVGCLSRFTATLKEMFEGWKVYQSYTEVWAGLGLAFLYMTVMGFDSITNGYSYSQGLPEWAIGVVVALGSIAGIAGTLIYPILRRRVGLERTGLYSMVIQITFLTLCLASVWAPGSPYIADYSGYATDAALDGGAFTPAPAVGLGVFTTATSVPASNSTAGVQCKYTEEMNTSFVSIGLFYAGLILSRIGLWSFDLTVNQIIQQKVEENNRGAFSGVQRAMECSFDMIHFVLVIALPCPETFGILIILSFIFVAVGQSFYSVYSYKIRGHLIHTEKFVPCISHTHV